MVAFSDKEAKILKEFIRIFRYSFAAYLREEPRPSPEHEYQRRMAPGEAAELWAKLDLPGTP